MSEKMPVYVRIEEYKDVLDILSVVKERLAEAKTILADIEEIKSKEDSEIESWKISVDDIEDKVKFVDETLVQPE